MSSSSPSTASKYRPPPKHGLERLDPFTPESVLLKSQSNRDVIQDFVPLAESLEWDLGQQYLRERGNKAFISRRFARALCHQ